MTKSNLTNACAAVAVMCAALPAGRHGVYIFTEGQYTDGSFLTAFHGFIMLNILPLLAVLIFSVTVYATPVCFFLLFAETLRDVRLAYLCIKSVQASGLNAQSIFFLAVRAVFAYTFWVLTLRTASFRQHTRQTGLRWDETAAYFRDYTSVAGLFCLFGLFSHAVFYFT